MAIVVADVSHLDSATQGPNPQDIATPEPEYIDIDLPPPPAARPQQLRAAPVHQQFLAGPAPAPQHFHHARTVYAAPPRYHAPAPIHAPISKHLIHEPVVGHSLESDGYHYKTVRRLKYRYRY